MAQHFYGVNLGAEGPDDVTVGTTDTGDSVQVVTVDATGMSKTAFIKLITVLYEYFVVNNTPA